MPLYKAAGNNLTALVAADGSSGGFIKDSQATAAGLGVLGAADGDAIVALYDATDAEARAASASNKWLTPANLAGRAAFMATLNGTDQTGNADNAFAQVLFSTEVADRGSLFASSLWTPPSGLVTLHTQVNLASTNLTAGDAVTLRIYKNGTGGSILATRQTVVPTATTQTYASITTADLANGTDTYGVWAFVNTATNGTWDVEGSTFASYFCGWQI